MLNWLTKFVVQRGITIIAPYPVAICRSRLKINKMLFASDPISNVQSNKIRVPNITETRELYACNTVSVSVDNLTSNVPVIRVDSRLYILYTKIENENHHQVTV